MSSYQNHGWRHRPKHLGGTDPTPGFTAWAAAFVDTDTEITAFSSEHVPFDRFWTNAPELFSTVPDGVAGDAQIQCAEYGVYLVTLTVEWEDIGADYPHSSRISESRLSGFNLGALGVGAATASVAQYPPTGDNGPLDTGDVSIGIHESWDYTTTQPAGWQIFVSNGHSVAVDVLRARLAVVRLPNGRRNQDYVVY